jgi:hypothetical protein
MSCPRECEDYIIIIMLYIRSINHTQCTYILLCIEFAHPHFPEWPNLSIYLTKNTKTFSDLPLELQGFRSHTYMHLPVLTL